MFDFDIGRFSVHKITPVMGLKGMKGV